MIPLFDPLFRSYLVTFRYKYPYFMLFCVILGHFTGHERGPFHFIHFYLRFHELPIYDLILSRHETDPPKCTIHYFTVFAIMV